MAEASDAPVAVGSEPCDARPLGGNIRVERTRMANRNAPTLTGQVVKAGDIAEPPETDADHR